VGAFFGVAVKVWVPSPHLLLERLDHVPGREAASFLGYHDLEGDVKEQVA
jgi:hypothetical protein